MRFRLNLSATETTDSHLRLQASASEAGSQLPSNAKGYLGYVLSHRNDASILPVIENAVECRTEIKEAMIGNRCVCWVSLACNTQRRKKNMAGMTSQLRPGRLQQFLSLVSPFSFMCKTKPARSRSRCQA